jgi:hypothetical protein
VLDSLNFLRVVRADAKHEEDSFECCRSFPKLKGKLFGSSIKYPFRLHPLSVSISVLDDGKDGPRMRGPSILVVGYYKRIITSCEGSAPTSPLALMRNQEV